MYAIDARPDTTTIANACKFGVPSYEFWIFRAPGHSYRDKMALSVLGRQQALRRESDHTKPMLRSNVGLKNNEAECFRIAGSAAHTSVK